jgi:hypothetical protein
LENSKFQHLEIGKFINNSTLRFKKPNQTFTFKIRGKYWFS